MRVRILGPILFEDITTQERLTKVSTFPHFPYHYMIAEVCVSVIFYS